MAIWLRSCSLRKITMTKLATLLLAATICSAGVAHADEAEFLQSLDGSWRGSGTVEVRADASPMKVSCKFNTDTTASSLALNGKCTSLAIFSRVIGADLKVQGADYSGSYVGAGTGTAGLSGKRAGDSINLDIRWAKDVNGDRSAKMTIERVGETGMRLTTTDTHPTTGESIVTSRIDLKRS
jgi:hypothetical protein